MRIMLEDIGKWVTVQFNYGKTNGILVARTGFGLNAINGTTYLVYLPDEKKTYYVSAGDIIRKSIEKISEPTKLTWMKMRGD